MSRNNSRNSRSDIQGLRAVAILSVLIFHFLPEYFPNGFLGVDIFFVISGYLIFTIFSRSVTKNGLNTVTVLEFYYKRVARIIPLSSLYVFLGVLFFSILASPTIIEDSKISALKAMTYTTNLFAIYEHNDYFKNILDENLFTHFWSLALEMQFYFIVPILFFVRVEYFPTAIHSFVFPLIGLSSFIYFCVSSPLTSFNSPLTRLWQFFAITPFCKIVLPEIERPKAARRSSSANLLEKGDKTGVELDEQVNASSPTIFPHRFLLAAAFMGICVPCIPYTINPLLARCIVVYSATILIALGEENPILSNPVMVWLGDISYTLYLLHWPFAVYIVRASTTREMIRYVCFPGTITITFIIYNLYEKKYRTWSKIGTVKIVMLWTLLTFVALKISTTVNEEAQRLATFSLFTSRIENGSVEWENALRRNEEMFRDPKNNLMVKDCKYYPWKNITDPASTEHIQAPLGACDMPNGRGKLKFLVMGNSYTANLGEHVWNNFKPDIFRDYFGEYHSFSQQACEVFTKTLVSHCKYYANFTDVIEFYKPDVTFIIQRYGASKDNNLPPEGTADTILDEMKMRLDHIRNKTDLFFVMDSFPSTAGPIHTINRLIMAGKTEEQINAMMFNPDDDIRGHNRTKALANYCGEGHFRAYDGDAYLAMLEPSGHVTKYGKERIDKVFGKLAQQYGPVLKKLEKKLYP